MAETKCEREREREIDLRRNIKVIVHRSIAFINQFALFFFWCGSMKTEKRWGTFHEIAFGNA